MRTCVIFDIDGTLVDSSSFESRLYALAVCEALGLPAIDTDWSRYEHVTDTGVVIELCRRHGAAVVERAPRARARFGELVAAHFASGGRCPAIPGAMELFARLAASGECALGIATGGWGHTAQMKLRHAGFDWDGICFASADDHHTRVGIMQHCRARLPATAHTIYVGDGQWDRVASARLEWEFIGIGERLRGRCSTWAPDLSSPVLAAAIGL